MCALHQLQTMHAAALALAARLALLHGWHAVRMLAQCRRWDVGREHWRRRCTLLR
jgi:hypothetical protein